MFNFRNENISLQVGIFSHSMLSVCSNAPLHEVHHHVFLRAPFDTHYRHLILEQEWGNFLVQLSGTDFAIMNPWPIENCS